MYLHVREAYLEFCRRLPHVGGCARGVMKVCECHMTLKQDVCVHMYNELFRTHSDHRKD